MKTRILSFFMFAAIVISISLIGGIKKSTLADPNHSKNMLAWAALTCKAKGDARQQFAIGVAGTYVSTCASCAAAFCWGGPAGIVAGVVVGL
jgi:hypothetical protein